MTRRATFPPGEAREDWAILRALSEALGATLPWNSLDELRARDVQGGAASGAPRPVDAGRCVRARRAGAGRPAQMSAEAFASPVKDFYLTNPIARASRIMAECSALRHERRLEAAE